MQTPTPKRCVLLAVFLLFGVGARPCVVVAADKKLHFEDAVMCEGVRELAPINRAVVFSMAIGRVSCFSSFDRVPRQTFIYHRWYHQDALSTKKKLFLKPPSWSTYSSIQLREADKGPWRVEITDEKGTLFAILRFSVTD
jgi:hypothetical protein